MFNIQLRDAFCSPQTSNNTVFYTKLWVTELCTMSQKCLTWNEMVQRAGGSVRRRNPWCRQEHEFREKFKNETYPKQL